MTTRRPLLAGNWKMYGTHDEAEALARALTASVGTETGREVLLAPPYTALATVRAAIAGTSIHLGAQNVHWGTSGAFTGEVSAPMLREAGCSHVIIGHSERRQLFGETDQTVNQRLGAALAHGLVPIVCVGETLEEREAGQTTDVVRRQITGAFADVSPDQIGQTVVAYEPIWAIGTGKTATPEQAEEVHAFLRSELQRLATEPVAQAVRILYGGSVKPGNVDQLMAQPDIDGALVGGASLDAESFARIVRFEETA